MSDKVHHPKFKGAPQTRQQERSKERRRNVDTNKCNMGGEKGFAYYKDMPGVHVDQFDNREMIKFIVQPDGKCTAICYAHNILIKRCIDESMSNPMLKGIITSAALDHIFKNKTPFNWLLRKRYAFLLFIQSFKAERKKRKLLKALSKTKIDGEE